MGQKKKKKQLSSKAVGNNANEPINSATFVTEQSDEESKDDENSKDVMITPKNPMEEAISPVNNVEDMDMQDYDPERRDSLMYASFDKPN